MAQENMKRRIRQLEEQLRHLNREQDDLRRRMTQENEARIRRMNDDIHRLDASYTERVREMREELSAEMQRNVDAIRRVDQQSQARRTQLLQELQQVNQELRDEVEELWNQQNRQQGMGRTTAEQLLNQAQAQAHAVDGEPHTFFCPGQFEVLQEHLSTALHMLELELYDSAAAMADASLTELELLGIEVRERQREWEQIYQVYDAISSGLYQAMEAFEQEPLQTPLGAFVLGDEERAYWSRDQYQSVRCRVLDAYKMVEGVRGAGSVTAFLRFHTALRGFALTSRISELRRLNEQLTAVTLCIRSELFYSDQRCQMAEQAERLLCETGYQVRQSKFRGDPENLLDCYELTATINGIDMVTLLFVPQREDGIAVRNICILIPDVKTLPNLELIRGEAQALIGSLQQEIPGLKAIWYPADSTQLPIAEQQFKRQPDAQQLARRLERKYQ